MLKAKTQAIFVIMIFVVVIIGFVLLFTRKQTVDSATGAVKFSWKKADEPAPPAAK